MMTFKTRRTTADDDICPQRGRRCRPVNHVLITVPGSLTEEAYSCCGCGKRYPISDELRRTLRRTVRSAGPDRNGLRNPELEKCLTERCWPLHRTSNLAKTGIAPVGTPSLHTATTQVGELTPALGAFAQHMLRAMRQARGIGLAANQLDVPLRILAHGLPSIAPPVLVNATITATRGSSEHREGCLSLELADVAALVTRPRRLTMHAQTPEGESVAIAADEYLARVLQHEIDHLDGIEYVQRLTGSEKDRVYALMSHHGVPVNLMPLLT